MAEVAVAELLPRPTPLTVSEKYPSQDPPQSAVPVLLSKSIAL